MGRLFDMAKKLAQPELSDIADRQAPEIAARIVSQLGPCSKRLRAAWTMIRST